MTNQQAIKAPWYVPYEGAVNTSQLVSFWDGFIFLGGVVSEGNFVWSLGGSCAVGGGQLQPLLWCQEEWGGWEGKCASIDGQRILKDSSSLLSNFKSKSWEPMSPGFCPLEGGGPGMGVIPKLGFSR